MSPVHAGLEQPAGWHASWCVPLGGWSVKLSTFAHKELDIPDNNSIDRFLTMRRTGVWFDGVAHGTRAFYGVNYMFAPLYVTQHPERFGYLIDPDSSVGDPLLESLPPHDSTSYTYP